MHLKIARMFNYRAVRVLLEALKVHERANTRDKGDYKILTEAMRGPMEVCTTRGGRTKVLSSLQIENSQILGLIRIEKFLGWANQQIANLQKCYICRRSVNVTNY
jgi:hypothetical protein